MRQPISKLSVGVTGFEPSTLPPQAGCANCADYPRGSPIPLSPKYLLIPLFLIWDSRRTASRLSSHFIVCMTIQGMPLFVDLFLPELCC